MTDARDTPPTVRLATIEDELEELRQRIERHSARLDELAARLDELEAPEPGLLARLTGGRK